MGQVAFTGELSEPGDGPQFSPLFLWLCPEDNLRQHGARLAPCLVQSQDIRWADLELTFPTVTIGVALIVGLAAGLRISVIVSGDFTRW